MILILKMEDGTTQEFGMGEFVGSLVRAIREANGDSEVATIIAGEVTRGLTPAVLWEKQFNAVDVVPSDFGKASQS